MPTFPKVYELALNFIYMSSVRLKISTNFLSNYKSIDFPKAIIPDLQSK